MSHPCATPQLRSASLQQLQLQQQQQLRRAGCSAARVVAPAARAAGPQRAQGVATTQQLSGLGVRLVAAAIPVRYTSGRTEVCLVTSSKGEGLVLPKVCPSFCGSRTLIAADGPHQGYLASRAQQAYSPVWYQC